MCVSVCVCVSFFFFFFFFFFWCFFFFFFFFFFFYFFFFFFFFVSSFTVPLIPLLCFIIVFKTMSVSLWCFTDEIEYPYMDRTDFLIYKSPYCLSSKFQVSWPFGQEKKRKTDFQDSRHGGHLGFRIENILAIFFIYKTLRCFLSSFNLIGLSVQEKKRKIDFQDGHLVFPIGTI